MLSIGGIGDLPSLLQALGNNVDTNMTIDDAEAIYDLVEGVNSASILHVSLDDSNFLYECRYPTNCAADYLFAHNSGYGAHRPVHPERLRPAAALGEDPTVGIEDGSGTGDGASTRWAGIFAQLGWSTQDLGRVPTLPVTEVIDQSGGKDAAAANGSRHTLVSPSRRCRRPARGRPAPPTG